MVLQMLDQIPAGPIMAKVPRIIKVPEGEVWVETENPLGQMGYYVVSKGATGPFRVKIRSGERSATSRSCPGCCAASTFPMSSRSSGRCTSSSETLTGDTTIPMTRWLGDRLGHDARDQDDRRPRDHPVRRAHPRLHVPAQDDEPHAEPARSDGPRRLPRLVPARRRRHEVPPEGGHHAGRGRSAGLRAGAGRRRDVDVPGLPRDPDRAAPRGQGPRRRRVLRAGGLEPLGHRRAHGRLGERQQVRARSARCAPPRSSSPTSCRCCSPSSAWSSRPAR